jgi:hypothetical protein
MDHIIITRLKSYLQRKLEISPDVPIIRKDDNLIEVLSLVCEFVETIQSQNDLDGSEKKILVINYFTQIVNDSINTQSVNVENSSVNIYPNSSVNTLRTETKFFIDNIIGKVIDVFVNATRGKYIVDKTVPPYEDDTRSVVSLKLTSGNLKSLVKSRSKFGSQK